MGTPFVVFLTPFFYGPCGVMNVGEPMRRQALVTESRVERLDEPVLLRLPRLRECELDPLGLRPLLQLSRPELRTVVESELLRQTKPLGKTVQNVNHVGGRIPDSRFQMQAVASIEVKDREASKRNDG